MARLLVLVLVAYGAFLLTDRVRLLTGDVGTRIEGNTVHRLADEIEGRFQRVGSLEATWMVFGGDPGGQRNALAHATVAGLDLRAAQSIAARYPDFHRCSSPGAGEAQGQTETLAVVAANGLAREAVRDAVRQHDARLRSGGERTCLSLRGATLSLEGARTVEGDHDLSGRLVPAFRRVRFILAEEARVRDCGPLLSPARSAR